jgi:DNA invertase Pin-like site-specific DNA recombinase
MRFGYARVSTSEQDTSMQVELFRSAGVEVFFEDSASGVKKRPELERMLSFLRSGDEVVVYKVDRVARSLDGLLRVLRVVEKRGALFRSLTEPFDTAGLTGRLVLQMLGAFAEFERGMIRERCSAGIASALARGVKFGRDRTFDYGRMLELRASGLTVADVASSLGRPASTVRGALERLGRPTRGVVGLVVS